jgi:PIN domain nuclease of toxin-antitoxin system
VIVVDTHVLLWLSEGSDRIGRIARRKIEQAAKRRELFVSAISYWELGMLTAAGRLRLPRGVEALRAAAQVGGIPEVPVDGEIATAAARLEGLHGDPADRIIFATALCAGAALVTADERLLAARSGPKRLDAQA